jgi:hypothetical protein
LTAPSYELAIEHDLCLGASGARAVSASFSSSAGSARALAEVGSYKRLECSASLKPARLVEFDIRQARCPRPSLQLPIVASCT